MINRLRLRSRLAYGAATVMLLVNLTATAGAGGLAPTVPILNGLSSADAGVPLIRISKSGDKIAAGIAGAVVGGLIGAALANSDKNYRPGYQPPYQPPYQPGYGPGPYVPPAPGRHHNANRRYKDFTRQACVAYGQEFSRKGGARGLQLDSVVSITTRGYNQYVMVAYMTVLWPTYRKASYVTCTVTNGQVTSWQVS